MNKFSSLSKRVLLRKLTITDSNTSGVPQGSVLGPLLFNIFVGDTDSGIQCTLSKFANDTKLRGAVDMLQGRDVVQRDLDRHEMWARANLMKFNKAKCKVLHMDQGNPQHKYRLGGKWGGSSPKEKDLGMLVDEKLNIESQIHRIIECFGLEGTFRGHLAQRPCSKQGHLQLEQVA